MPAAPAPQTPAAQLAKAALRRLALAHAEPTPENYARAYDEELGVAPRPVLPVRSQALLERMTGALRCDDAERSALLEAFVGGQSGPAERLLSALAAREAAQAPALVALLRGLVRGLERADRHWTLARKKESLRIVFDHSGADAAAPAAAAVAAAGDLGARRASNSGHAEFDPPARSARRARPAALAAPGPASDAHAGCVALIDTLGATLGRALPADDAAAACSPPRSAPA